MSVSYHGRNVAVRVSHIGIDEDFIKSIMNTSTFKKEIKKFKEEFKVIADLAKESSAKM